MIVRAYLKDRAATNGSDREAEAPDVEPSFLLEADPRVR